MTWIKANVIDFWIIKQSNISPKSHPVIY
jgi:hypothetical protein